MTVERMGDHEWTLCFGYRRTRFGGFKSIVYWNPGWVAMNLDGVRSRLVWTGYALTARGIRRRTARALRRERRAAERRDSWTTGGRR